MCICSEPGLRKRKLAVVRKDLCNNGYPSQVLRTQQLRSSVACPEEVREADRRKRAAVPYAQGVSEALERVYGTYGVKITYVPTTKLKQKLARVKDRLRNSRFPGGYLQDTMQRL